MSLPNVTPRNGYIGNNLTTVFTYTFRILDATHLHVYLDNVLQTTGYTVTGVGVLGGGTVTFAVAPAALVRVTLSRFTPIDQLTTYLSFEQNDLTAAQAMESALDKFTMILQELRALQVPFIQSYDVAAGAVSLPVIHSLNTLEAILLSANADWSVGEITPVITDANTITLHFTNSPSAAGVVNVMIAPGDNAILAQYTGVNDPGLTSLINRTGATLALGEVVGIDPANDSSVVLADTVSTKKQLTVVLDESIAALATGRFVQHGYAVVKTTGAVTRGHYLVKSATTKRAEDSGTAHGDVVTMPDGTLAIALTASAGGLSQVNALLLGGVLSTQSVLTFGITPTTQAFNDVPVIGAHANSANADHKHGMPRGPLYFLKTPEQVLTPSNTDLENISGLVFPVQVQKVYSFKLTLLLSAPSTLADFRFGWTTPAGTELFWGPQVAYDGANFTFYWTGGNLADQTAILVDSSTLVVQAINGITGIKLEGIVRVGDTPGNVQLRGAQAAVVAENDKVLRGSYLEVVLLNP